MKRSVSESAKTPKSKKQRELEPDYCDITPKLGEDGSIVWPAATEAIEDAGTFLKQWFGWRQTNNECSTTDTCF